jgi:sigma-B regulation protein RsbU (phosphoserine phosphatase)
MHGRADEDAARLGSYAHMRRAGPKSYTDNSKSSVPLTSCNCAVTRKSAPQLRIHVEDCSRTAVTAAEQFPQLAALCDSFERATGWQLRYQTFPAELGEEWSAPVADGRGESAGRITLHRPAVDSPPAGGDLDPVVRPELARVRPLALAIANMLGEMNRLGHAIWQREAELAAGVPVAARLGEEAHLADRLEAVLQGGAEAVGATAAGLYLLDEATSSLKLRAAYGLPQERLLLPARTLRGAVADLEALVGHAVVLEDTALLPHWRCPEDFPSAVCVPVSSPSMPLGTLWVFSSQPRDFSPAETNLIEIVAGRLAADLEREMLLAAGSEAKQREKQFDLAERWQYDRLPRVAPLVEGFELAGWTRQASGIGGDFYDWTVLPDGCIAAMVGDAQGTLLEAGLNAAALQAAVRAHAVYRHNAGSILARVNETLWTGSAGDQFAALSYALIEPGRGIVEFALAGRGAVLLFPGDRSSPRLLSRDAPLLGNDPDAEFPEGRDALHPGDTLILLSDGARRAASAAGLIEADAQTAEPKLGAALAPGSAEQTVSRLRQLLDRGDSRDDLTVLVVKRRS